MKFKVGDKVKYIGETEMHEDFHISTNDILKIEYIKEHDDIYRVKNESLDIDFYIENKYLELHERKIGDVWFKEHESWIQEQETWAIEDIQNDLKEYSKNEPGCLGAALNFSDEDECIDHVKKNISASKCRKFQFEGYMPESPLAEDNGEWLENYISECEYITIKKSKKDRPIGIPFSKWKITMEEIIE